MVLGTQVKVAILQPSADLNAEMQTPLAANKLPVNKPAHRFQRTGPVQAFDPSKPRGGVIQGLFARRDCFTAAGVAQQETLIEVKTHDLTGRLSRDEEITLGRDVQLGLAAMGVLVSELAVDDVRVPQSEHREVFAASAKLLETKKFNSHFKEHGKAFTLLTQKYAKYLTPVILDGMRARSVFIVKTLRWVDEIVDLKKRHAKFLRNELIGEARTKLIGAVDDFDPERGYVFITFAEWRIKHAIQCYFLTQGKDVRSPAHRVQNRKAIESAEVYLQNLWQRKPTETELAEFLGIELDQLYQDRASKADVVSLDAPLKTDGDKRTGALHEIISSTHDIDDEDKTDIPADSPLRIRNAIIKNFEAREAIILLNVFGLLNTEKKRIALRKLGPMLGISHEFVRKIEIEQTPMLFFILKHEKIIPRKMKKDEFVDWVSGSRQEGKGQRGAQTAELLPNEILAQALAAK